MDRAIRLAVINSHPIQYFAPLYAYLNRSPALEVTALYCSNLSLRGATDPGFKRQVVWDVDLLAGYRSVFLGDNATRRTPRGYWSLVCPQVWTEIRSCRYDAILLHGYSHAVTLLAFVAAKTMRIPVLMRSETHLGQRGDGLKRRVRDAVLSVAYRLIDGFLAIGTANRAYYSALGVPDGKIFDVPYTVDNARFTAAASILPEQRASIRNNYGIAVDAVVVLYASKFMRRKHPDDVIRAMASLGAKGTSATLLMVGTGEMEHELRDLARFLNVKNVIFTGFLNQSQLPMIYAASDIFVLPSENEPWGLVVNEVMCAGIPVIVSREMGCVPDLVKDGINGLLMDAGDATSLASAIEGLLVDKNRRVRMGAAGRSIIDKWSYEQCREGVTAALTAVVR